MKIRDFVLALAVPGVLFAAGFELASCSGGSSNENENDDGAGEGGAAGEGNSSGQGEGGGAAAGGEGGSSPAAGGQGGQETPTGGTGGGGGSNASGGQGGTPPPAKCDGLPGLKLTRLARTQTSAMALAQAAGDDRIFVAERSGVVRILRGTQLSSTPFLDIRSSIAPHQRGERGLLNIALHPKWRDNGRFYLFYTRRQDDPMSSGQEGDIVIAEGKRSAADPDKADGKVTPLLVISHSQDDGHNGGVLAFGLDGYLYAGTGDGGGGYDSFKNGQRKESGLSKILRIDVENPKTPPVGNMGDGAYPHAFAWGTRNPFRGGFDRLTGDLYFGDVGESSWEEISVLYKGSQAGVNFGWGNPGMEGAHCFPWFSPDPCQPLGQLPLLEYFHDGNGVMTDPKSHMGAGKACGGGTDADCSRAVVGGYVYRGKAIPDLQGRYFYGDHVKNQVFSLVNDKGKATCIVEHKDLSSNATPLQGLSGFGEDANGELYLLDLFGNIYRLDKR